MYCSDGFNLIPTDTESYIGQEGSPSTAPLEAAVDDCEVRFVGELVQQNRFQKQGESVMHRYRLFARSEGQAGKATSPKCAKSLV